MTNLSRIVNRIKSDGLSLKNFNRIRRRIHENFDYSAVGISRLFNKPVSSEVSDENINDISVIIVNFNTMYLTKLMLFTLVQQIGNEINKIILVDNASTDGSFDFFSKLERASNKVYVTTPPFWKRHHGSGLRWGIQTLDAIETSERTTKYYLICDSDIIFLRPDLIQNIQKKMTQTNAKLIGEMQYDVGEPYIHPSCMLLDAQAYHNPQVWPFLVHGAPALKLQQSMRHADIHIEDFPVRSDEYIVHKGRGTIAGIQAHSRTNAHYTGIPDAHFHGNMNGQAIWDKTEASYEYLLSKNNESQAIDHILKFLS